jgi:iduronate 2-sulfatase
LTDTQTAGQAVKTLRKLAPKALTGEHPFFVAVGFHRPHLPFVFPEEFLQYYPEEDIQLPANPHAPVNMPEIAWSNFDELRMYRDIGTAYGYGSINSTLPDKIVRQLRRAYYAATSFTDSLVGQVVGELEKLGLANSTIISFWGDHGWQLGEHGEWCKNTNFEITTHAPMMVHVPGQTDKGLSTEALTEFVDLFPSLVELAGFPALPLCPVDSTKTASCREGKSFSPLIKTPKQAWKQAAFSQYPRMAIDGNIFMGYTMRTDRYRYTEWAKFHPYPIFKPEWPARLTNQNAELYDHQIDPEENYNRVADPSYKDAARKLSAILRKGWRNV